MSVRTARGSTTGGHSEVDGKGVVGPIGNPACSPVLRGIPLVVLQHPTARNGFAFRLNGRDALRAVLIFSSLRSNGTIAVLDIGAKRMRLLPKLLA